jgi:hypothetical protein
MLRQLGMVHENTQAAMTPLQHPRKPRNLARELAWVVAIKLGLITVLWWAFVKDNRVHVSPQDTPLPWIPPGSPPESPTHDQ